VWWIYGGFVVDLWLFMVVLWLACGGFVMDLWWICGGFVISGFMVVLWWIYGGNEKSSPCELSKD
jgi:hypothetical protein